MNNRLQQLLQIAGLSADNQFKQAQTQHLQQQTGNMQEQNPYELAMLGAKTQQEQSQASKLGTEAQNYPEMLKNQLLEHQASSVGNLARSYGMLGDVQGHSDFMHNFVPQLYPGISWPHPMQPLQPLHLLMQQMSPDKIMAFQQMLSQAQQPQSLPSTQPSRN